MGRSIWSNFAIVQMDFLWLKIARTAIVFEWKNRELSRRFERTTSTSNVLEQNRHKRLLSPDSSDCLRKLCGTQTMRTDLKSHTKICNSQCDESQPISCSSINLWSHFVIKSMPNHSSINLYVHSPISISHTKHYDLSQFRMRSNAREDFVFIANFSFSFVRTAIVVFAKKGIFPVHNWALAISCKITALYYMYGRCRTVTLICLAVRFSEHLPIPNEQFPIELIRKYT